MATTYDDPGLTYDGASAYDGGNVLMGRGRRRMIVNVVMGAGCGALVMRAFPANLVHVKASETPQGMAREEDELLLLLL